MKNPGQNYYVDNQAKINSKGFLFLLQIDEKFTRLEVGGSQGNKVNPVYANSALKPLTSEAIVVDKLHWYTNTNIEAIKQQFEVS